MNKILSLIVLCGSTAVITAAGYAAESTDMRVTGSPLDTEAVATAPAPDPETQVMEKKAAGKAPAPKVDLPKADLEDTAYAAPEAFTSEKSEAFAEEEPREEDIVEEEADYESPAGEESSLEEVGGQDAALDITGDLGK